MKSKSRAIAFSTPGTAIEAEEALYEIGFYSSSGEGDPEGGHYVISSLKVGRIRQPIIRSVNDDREVLGDIAKQLVIAGFCFRIVPIW